MTKLTRAEIRKVLKRNRLMAEIGRGLGITTTTVASVLRGKSTSARVMAACEKRALEILEA